MLTSILSYYFQPDWTIVILIVKSKLVSNSYFQPCNAFQVHYRSVCLLAIRGDARQKEKQPKRNRNSGNTV